MTYYKKNIKQAVIFVFIPSPGHLIRGLVGSVFMIKFFLQKIESGIKDLSGGNSFSQKSLDEADDYLWDVYNIQKEIHKEHDLSFPDSTRIFDDEIINGYHYFNFKKFYDKFYPFFMGLLGFAFISTSLSAIFN